MMHVIRCRAAVLGLASLMVISASAAAEDAAKPAPSDAAARKAAMAEAKAADKAEALAVLKRASDFLAKQKELSFEAELGFDAVQSTGQKLEFGGTRKITVRRPDRLHVEAASRSGDRRTLRFDGEHFSIDLPEEHAYVSLKRPGTLNELIDYLTDDVGVPAPLHDLIYRDFYASIVDRIESGLIVGETTIGATRCQHLALSSNVLDFQIWIASGDRPLPARIVITHKQEEESPQFWARIHTWNLDPPTPDALFAFTPPEGAEQLSVRPAGRLAPAGGK